MELENQVQQQNEVNVDTQPQVQEEPKMVQMTQEQLDKLISDRLARQERKLNEAFDKRLNELSEAQKLAQMSEEERKEHDFAKRLEELTNREKALQERENAYNKQQYKQEIQRQLSDAGLPDISDTLVGLEAEVVKTQINTMKQAFDNQVNASIQAKVKASANTPTVPQVEQQLLTLEQIQSLSIDEYNANRDLVQQSLKMLNKK
jgi:hypothetical protein